jgi:hypothetical protein
MARLFGRAPVLAKSIGIHVDAPADLFVQPLPPRKGTESQQHQAGDANISTLLTFLRNAAGDRHALLRLRKHAKA